MNKLLNDALVAPMTELVRKIIHLFAVVDCSSSMDGEKMAAANYAMRESIGELKIEATNHPEIDFRFGCIAFDNDAYWSIGPDPVKIQQVVWNDLMTDGCTSTGAAVHALTNAVQKERMPKQAHAPVMVLISDGGNTDGEAYDEAIERLNSSFWGRNAVRLSIGIGEGYDRNQLAKFATDPTTGVLEAKNAIELVNQIRYATVYATMNAAKATPQASSMIQNMRHLPSSITDAEFSLIEA